MAVVVLLLLLLLVALASSAPSSAPLRRGRGGYACAVCRHVAGEVAKGAAEREQWRDLTEKCRRDDPEGRCDDAGHDGPALRAKLKTLLKNEAAEGAHAACVMASLCDDQEAWRAVDNRAAAAPDVRVARGYGRRGYAAMRVSVVANDTGYELPALTAAPADAYDAPFRFRWTQLRIRTELVEAAPGWNAVVLPGAPDARFYLPPPGAPTVGVYLADPCFSSEFVPCTWGETYNTFERIPGLLNAATSYLASDGTPEVASWGIFGDNFYDRYGHLTASFFGQLSLRTKLTAMVASAGNHDYWAYGSPVVAVKNDQYGNGFMQYYAQDTAAALDPAHNSSAPFNFAVDPDNATTDRVPRWWPKWLPSPIHGSASATSRESNVANFQSFFSIGNLGIISYSGAYKFEEQQAFLTEACSHFASDANVAAIALVGHWSDCNDGCTDGMHVGGLFHHIIGNVQACGEMDDAKKFFYLQGHDHCNVVIEERGFQVAGQGMSGCGARQNFGITVVDTLSEPSKLKVVYVPVMDPFGMDKYDEVTTCFEQNGVTACAAKLGEAWLTVDLDKPLAAF